jgi:hypothetical protein
VVGNCPGERESLLVADEPSSPRDPIDWHARYRIDPATTWSDCRLLDVTLTGAFVELSGPVPDDPTCELSFVLQIDSIADDDVGITMQASIQNLEHTDTGTVIAEIAFRARREEQLLLHLLVRLHSLV